MNATDYYERNAVLHHREAPVSAVATSGAMVPRPNQIDWSVHWLREMALPQPAACLDVGCSTLTLLRSLAGTFSRRAGVDIAAQQNWPIHADIETQVCDLDKGPLPFADGSFSAVTMLMVLEHVFDPYHAVREVRRVCQADGWVIIGVPNLAGITHRLSLLRGKLPVTSSWQSFAEGSWDGFHLHNFTQDSLAWLLRREGLKPVKWACQGRFQFLKRLRPGFFGSDLTVLCRVATPEPGLPAHF